MRAQATRGTSCAEYPSAGIKWVRFGSAVQTHAFQSLLWEIRCDGAHIAPVRRGAQHCLGNIAVFPHHRKPQKEK